MRAARFGLANYSILNPGEKKKKKKNGRKTGQAVASRRNLAGRHGAGVCSSNTSTASSYDS